MGTTETIAEMGHEAGEDAPAKQQEELCGGHMVSEGAEAEVTKDLEEDAENSS